MDIETKVRLDCYNRGYQDGVNAFEEVLKKRFKSDKWKRISVYKYDIYKMKKEVMEDKV